MPIVYRFIYIDISALSVVVFLTRQTFVLTDAFKSPKFHSLSNRALQKMTVFPA
jgi:hypothetical protein